MQSAAPPSSSTCRAGQRGSRCCTSAARPRVAAVSEPPPAPAAAPVTLHRDYEVGDGSTLHVKLEGGKVHVAGTPGMTLHWGLQASSEAWTLPPKDAWPAESVNYKDRAMQTKLGDAPTVFTPTAGATALAFVLKNGEGKWFGPSGESKAFVFQLSGDAPASAAAPPAAPFATKEWPLQDGYRVEAVVEKAPGGGSVVKLSAWRPNDNEAPPTSVHWASSRAEGKPWEAPPPGWSTDPSVSRDGGGGAWDTAFHAPAAPGAPATATLHLPQGMPGLNFIVRARDAWLKVDGHKETWVALPDPSQPPKFAPAPAAQKQAADAVAQRRSQSDVHSAWVPPPAGPPKGEATPAELDALAHPTGALAACGLPIPDWVVDSIISSESEAQKSLMHRFRMANEMLLKAEATATSTGEPVEAAIAGVFVWLRLFSTRQLVWNKSYNVKPREISAAQNALTATLCRMHRDLPAARDAVRLAMSCVGRGGTGDMGQRVRDEILDIQHRNHTAGGFMEQWHQKLHNNTTPDDVVICEGVLAYLSSGMDAGAYWKVLDAAGVTKERLASFERAIREEPRFDPHQAPGLQRDLTEYLRTLKAVHSGADLSSAADAVLGYKQASSQGVSIDNPPLDKVATPRLRSLCASAQAAAAAAPRAGDAAGAAAAATAALEACVAARRELLPWTKPGGTTVAGGRERDVIYLDQGLEAAIRTVIESTLPSLSQRPASDLLAISSLALESLALSAGGNTELIRCLAELRAASAAAARDEADWPLRAKAAADRTRLALGASSEGICAMLAPAAAKIADKLKLPPAPQITAFAEEVVRAGAAAPLSQLLRALEPRIRELAKMGAWQVISPVAASGKLVWADTLAGVRHTQYAEPTVLVTPRVAGDEDIAEGVVAVLTTDGVDVLSHVAVRARNEAVLFATCFDADAFAALKPMEGQQVSCAPSADGAEVVVTPGGGGAKAAASTGNAPAGDTLKPSTTGNPSGGGRSNAPPGGAKAEAPKSGGPRIIPRPFGGAYALRSEAFTPETVGGKSRNLNGLRNSKVPLPARVSLPAGCALAFGSFDEALKDAVNDAARETLTPLLAQLRALPIADSVPDALLASIQAGVKAMACPPTLKSSLLEALAAEKVAGSDALAIDDPTTGWPAAWAAITSVWASKWNARAVSACRKARLSHDDLSMAVLVQSVVPASYAFVLHTTNPVSNDATQLYGELVIGLGETLVGAYPGRALSFTANKKGADGAEAATVTSFPSKPTALLLKSPSLIFRSDSNGEDLEGFAGAGLYDSIVMQAAVEEGVAYAADKLMTDSAGRAELLQRIATAGVVAEAALGSPQDVEGCVTPEGDIVLVQTRPQV